MGDRGEMKRAQNINDHAGSLIRINKDGEIAETFSSITNPSSKKFIEVLDRLIKS